MTFKSDKVFIINSNKFGAIGYAPDSGRVSLYSKEGVRVLVIGGVVGMDVVHDTV